MPPMLSTRPAEARSRAFLWLAPLVCVVYLAGHSVGPPVASAEERCVDVSQTMYASGDVLIPRLAGRMHLNKPPFFHWVSYGMSALRGEAGLASVRLVSAWAAVGVVLLTYLLGRQRGGREVGWWAALLTATSFEVLNHGHRGTFDVLLTFFVCLTLYGYGALWKGRTASGYTMIVGGLVCGFLTKGFMGWMAPLLPMLVDRLGRPEPRRALRPVLWALPAVLAGSLAWYAYLVVAVPEARAVLRDVVMVNFGAASRGAKMAFHGEPFYYYLHALPMILLPWIAILWPALGRPRAGWRQWLSQERLALTWLFGNALFLTLVPAKAGRYLLPLIPAFSLLAAPAIAAIDSGVAPITARWRRWITTVTVTPAAVVLGVMPLWLWVRIGEGVAVCVLAPLALAAGLIACARLAWQGRLSLALRGLALVTLVGALPFFARWAPRNTLLRRDHASPEFGEYMARQSQLRTAAARVVPGWGARPADDGLGR